MSLRVKKEKCRAVTGTHTCNCHSCTCGDCVCPTHSSSVDPARELQRSNLCLSPTSFHLAPKKAFQSTNVREFYTPQQMSRKEAMEVSQMKSDLKELVKNTHLVLGEGTVNNYETTTAKHFESPVGKKIIEIPGTEPPPKLKDYGRTELAKEKWRANLVTMNQTVHRPLKGCAARIEVPKDDRTASHWSMGHERPELVSDYQRHFNTHTTKSMGEKLNLKANRERLLSSSVLKGDVGTQQWVSTIARTSELSMAHPVPGKKADFNEDEKKQLLMSHVSFGKVPMDYSTTNSSAFRAPKQRTCTLRP